MSEAARGWHYITKPAIVIVVVGGVAALTIALTTRMHRSQSTAGVMTIDFDDVAAPDEASETDAGDRRPALRCAAGAMASPQTTRQQYGELLRVIADRVHRRALLAQRKTYAEINEMVERREVDVAFVCSSPYVAGKARFGMEILVVPVTYGRKVYYSYILAHRDDPLNSFDDLRGKVFAFTDPLSNTGCLVPKYMLAQRGETPQSFFAEFYYAYSHDNAIRAVAEGIADGAAVDSLIWDYLQETDSTYTARTKIVHKSPPYGIPPVVVHPDLDPDLKRELKQVFLTLHEDQEAQIILRTLRIDRFEESDDAAYDSIRKMRRMLGQSDGRQP
ncbi:MAG: substrate-binding domain-containing protein [Planctomycetota bacterium]|jgi:phosphonate transport system substrate-binding protein